MDVEQINAAIAEVGKAVRAAKAAAREHADPNAADPDAVIDAVDEIGYALDAVNDVVPATSDATVWALTDDHVDEVAAATGRPAWYVRDHYELIMRTEVLPAARAAREQKELARSRARG